jgi:hypothetical protein
MKHMSLNIVTILPWYISGPDTSATGTSGDEPDQRPQLPPILNVSPAEEFSR